MDDENYAVEFVPQCNMHQIVMNMTVSPVPHAYTITTTSIPETSMLFNRDVTIAGIEERVSFQSLLTDHLAFLSDFRNSANNSCKTLY